MCIDEFEKIFENKIPKIDKTQKKKKLRLRHLKILKSIKQQKKQRTLKSLMMTTKAYVYGNGTCQKPSLLFYSYVVESYRLNMFFIIVAN